MSTLALCLCLWPYGTSDPTVRALEWTACMNAYVFCNLGELLPVQSTGVNVYDVRRK
jgi:hypothetical protein